MRNIYDIIAEQKALVDINIATYDLNYASNYLIESKEDYYIEEGVGEGIKNAANKVVEFIKNIIKKISELVKKVVNWLTGKKDTEAKLNQEIKNINEGVTDSEKNDDESDKEDWKNLSREEILERRRLRNLSRKNEKNKGKSIIIGGETPQEKKARDMKKIEDEKKRRKNIKNSYKKRDNLEEVMNACNKRVKLKAFRNLDDQIAIGKRFFNEVPTAIERLSKGEISFAVESDIIDKTFKRRNEFVSTHSKSIAEHIKRELFGDDDSESDGYINLLTDKVLYYLRNSDNVKQELIDKERKATDALNKLIRGAQATNDQKKLKEIQSFASFISTFVSNLISSIVKSRNTAEAIAVKAVEMYDLQLRKM